MGSKKKQNAIPFNQNEKDDMIAFLVQHFREYGVSRLWEKYAELRNTGSPFTTYHTRYMKHLAPDLHQIDCSVKTKLEIYKKYRIKVNKEYIKELKKHANVTFEEGVVVEFKMKDESEEVEETDDDNSVNGQIPGSPSRPKRTRDRAAKTDSAKKAREEDRIVDRVAPGTGIPMTNVAEGDDYDSGDDFISRKVTEKQKKNLWKFVLANYKKYNKWQMFIKYAAFQGGRRANTTYSRRFDVCIAPHIHLANCSFKTKLDICKKLKICLSADSFKKFKKHANIELNMEGSIFDFKMKDRQDAVEESDVDDVVPEPAAPPKRKRGRPRKAIPEQDPKRGRNEMKIEEDDEVIVDAEKPGTGIPNPDMIIVKPKQEELVYDDNFVVEQDYFYQDDNGMEDRLMAEMRSMKQEMMNKMNQKMQKNMKSMTASGDKKAAELKNEMKAMVNNLQGFMKKEIDSLKKDNKTLAKTVASLQKTTTDRSDDVDTVPNKKECLLKLKDFVHSLNSPEIEEIKQRIDTAIQDLPEDDEGPMPTRKIVRELDSMLRKMN